MTIKKSLSVALIFALIVGMFTGIHIAFGATQSVITSDGVLTHMGTDIVNGSTLTIPSNVKKIGDNCTNDYSYDIDHNVYNWQNDTQLSQPITSVVLPEGLVEIGSNGFSYFFDIENINFPSSLRKIGNASFYWVSQCDFILNDGLEYCGASFWNEGGTHKIVLPYSLKEFNGSFGMNSNSAQTAIMNIEFNNPKLIINAEKAFCIDFSEPGSYDDGWIDTLPKTDNIYFKIKGYKESTAQEMYNQLYEFAEQRDTKRGENGYWVKLVKWEALTGGLIEGTVSNPNDRTLSPDMKVVLKETSGLGNTEDLANLSYTESNIAQFDYTTGVYEHLLSNIKTFKPYVVLGNKVIGIGDVSSKAPATINVTLFKDFKGKLVNYKNEPIANKTINIKSGVTGKSSLLGSVTTDNNGEFLLEYGKSLSNSVTVLDGATEIYNTDIPDDDTYSVLQIPRKSYSVQVQAQNVTGENISGVNVILTDTDDSSKTYTLTESGTGLAIKYTASNVPEGVYKVTATKGSLIGEGEMTVDGDSGLGSYQITLKEKTYTVKLGANFTQRSSNPVNNAIVTLTGDKGSHTGTTDETGVATINDVKAGTYTYNIEQGEYISNGTIIVPTEGVDNVYWADLYSDVVKTYPLTITLLDDEGNTINNNIIKIINKATNEVLTSTTDDTGKCTVNLKAGDYKVLSTYNNSVANQEISVSSTSTPTLDMSLEPLESTSINGTVVDLSNNQVSNIPVVLKDIDNNVVAVTNTKSDGSYEFTRFNSGIYTVEIKTPNGSIVTKTTTGGVVEDINIDYEKYQDKHINQSATIVAEGTVGTAAVVVTVPTSLSFIIQPQAIDTLYTVPSTIDNESNIPLDLTINQVDKLKDTAPNLVPSSTYTDDVWLQQGEEEVAVGLKVDNQDNWLNDKFSLSANSSIPVEPCVKYGLNWTTNRDDLDYNISLLVSLKE